MSESAAVSPAATRPVAHALEWLALSLTPGLGPTKARKLAEHFGSTEAVFRASLTELEEHWNSGSLGPVAGHRQVDGIGPGGIRRAQPTLASPSCPSQMLLIHRA